MKWHLYCNCTGRVVLVVSDVGCIGGDGVVEEVGDRGAGGVGEDNMDRVAVPAGLAVELMGVIDNLQ